MVHRGFLWGDSGLLLGSGLQGREPGSLAYLRGRGNFGDVDGWAWIGHRGMVECVHMEGWLGLGVTEVKWIGKELILRGNVPRDVC
jgi:hypothetical protein